MSMAELARRLKDPMEVQRLFWPQVEFYDKEVEMIYSVRDTPETHVRAGNKLGKDYTAGFIALGAFLFPETFIPSGIDDNEVRIVTTSVKDRHLNILWGEIIRYVNTSRIPLRVEDGGPLIVNQREIKKVINGAVDPISFLVGEVHKKGEAGAGAHASHTLLMGDEASGLDDEVYEFGQGWAKRMFFFGNPNQCNNFWFKAIKGA